MKYRFLAIILLYLTSCSGNKSDMVDSDSVKDWSKDNLYAQLFKLTAEDNYTMLSIRNPWQGENQKMLEYYIASKDEILPDSLPKSRIIRTPVEKVVCLSTTHIAMIDLLGGSEGIVGVSGIDYVSNIRVKERIEQGLVKEIGYDNNINNELIASMEPELVIAHGIGAETAAYMAKLEEAGIPVLFISDYLETNPLGRAEWIRVFGCLYEKSGEADNYFMKIAGEYEILRQEIISIEPYKPLVMTGLPYKDTWFISPGNSYLSTIIEDAGGTYIWEDQISDISIPMSLESVYIRALKADIWINSGAALSIDEILSMDSRLGDLPPVLNGMVFNNVKWLGANGGNDYWESGALSPHKILMDLASIFHPEYFPAFDPCYYIRLQ